MHNQGWIKLHRSLVDWEYYDDFNCLRLLIHLLVTVNYEDKRWRGELIGAGSRITSFEKLAFETNLTIAQVRTALKKLEKSGEITRRATNKFQLISLEKWDKLQLFVYEDDKQVNNQMTFKKQSNDKQITTTKEYKERKNIKEEKKKPLFDRWMEYRKQIRKPLKAESTRNNLVKKINEHSFEECEQVISSSIENGWQGLFWNKTKPNGLKQNNFSNQARSNTIGRQDYD
jgi:hypothetical protein